jgi:Coenzyme PQQ synthesis protein D (PqqD)
MDRLVVAPATAGAPVTVHGSGVAVWQLLDRPRSLAELAERLSEQFGVPAAQVAVDLAPTLDELVGLEVLEEA